MTHGCHNKPRVSPSSSYTAQNGWREFTDRGLPVKVPVWVEVKSNFGTSACQYDKSATDKECNGCHQQGKKKENGL